jgi:hypothetical protein
MARRKPLVNEVAFRRLISAIQLGTTIADSCAYADITIDAYKSAMRHGEDCRDDWSIKFRDTVKRAVEDASIGLTHRIRRAAEDREVSYETTDRDGNHRTVTKHIVGDWRAAEALLKYRERSTDRAETSELRRRLLTADVEKKELENLALKVVMATAAKGQGNGMILPPSIIALLPESTIDLLAQHGVSIIPRDRLFDQSKATDLPEFARYMAQKETREAVVVKSRKRPKKNDE